MAKRTTGTGGGPARANEPSVLILTSLASGPKHGYALARDIESFAGVTLGPGTLYGAISRLDERGLIEPAGNEQGRRPYRITASGRVALESAVRAMRQIADEGAVRLRLDPQAGPQGGTRAAGMPRVSPLQGGVA
jgi:DNA-binding PadR family transcriptional regulator